MLCWYKWLEKSICLHPLSRKSNKYQTSGILLDKIWVLFQEIQIHIQIQLEIQMTWEVNLSASIITQIQQKTDNGNFTGQRREIGPFWNQTSMLRWISWGCNCFAPAVAVDDDYDDGMVMMMMMMMMMMIRWWDHDDVSWSSVGEYLIWWPSHKNWMNRADAQSNLFNFVVYCHCCIILYAAACFMWCRIYKCCCILPQELKEPTWCPELCFFKIHIVFFCTCSCFVLYFHVLYILICRCTLHLYVLLCTVLLEVY